MVRNIAIALALAACHGSDQLVFEDAFVAVDAPPNLGAGPGGGLLPELRFALVGDTRPSLPDDTANYPTSVVQQIWTQVAAINPQFGVTTGDYMFATIDHSEQNPQLDLYLGARGAYGGVVYPALGNHECTSDTFSNCGDGNQDGEPPNYKAYLARLVGPIGETRPYFIERFAAIDGTWTAKFVFVAANAWDDRQAAWLDAVLQQPTTYTFVIRHEPHEATAAPGVAPSVDIVSKHPLTLNLVGHIHTYRHDADSFELLVGNGGAPLSTAVDFGYTIITRKPDGTLDVSSFNYMTNALIDQFALNPDGSLH
jgi:Calcineurin-like phosphoesterase